MDRNAINKLDFIYPQFCFIVNVYSNKSIPVPTRQSYIPAEYCVIDFTLNDVSCIRWIQ